MCECDTNMNTHRCEETRFCESIYIDRTEQQDQAMADYNTYVEDMLYADSIYSRAVNELVDEDIIRDPGDFDEDYSRDEAIKYTLMEYCEGPLELWRAMSFVVKPQKLVTAYIGAIVGLLALDFETEVAELSPDAVRAYYAALRILETRVENFNTWSINNKQEQSRDVK